MVAPNGARKLKKDHPEALTIKETVEVAKNCFEAGAKAIHLQEMIKENMCLMPKKSSFKGKNFKFQICTYKLQLKQ